MSIRSHALQRNMTETLNKWIQKREDITVAGHTSDRHI